MPSTHAADIRILNDGELRFNAPAERIHHQGVRAAYADQVRLRELVFAAHVLGVFRAHPNVLSFQLMFVCAFEIDGTQHTPRISGQAWPRRLKGSDSAKRWPAPSHGLLHPDDALELYQAIFGDGMYGHPTEWEAEFHRERFASALDCRIVKAAAAVELVKSP